MKFSQQMIFGASLLAAISATPITSVYATAPNNTQNTQTQNYKDPAQKLEHLAKSLNLTEVQKQQVKDILVKNADTFNTYYNQMLDSKREMMDLVFSTDYTKDKAEDIADDQSEIMEKIIELRAEQRHAIWAVLTPEQRITMKQMAQDHKAHMMDNN